MLTTLLAAAVALAVACSPTKIYNPYTNTEDLNDNTDPLYSPARPPSIPLAVKSPYTSAWSSTGENGTLNSNGVSFWTGDPLGWEGIVQVDGVSYEWLGTGSQALPRQLIKSATPLHVSYDSQYSNFTFQAGPVNIDTRFFSPVIPKDYCRTSIPLSYLTVSVIPNDGQPHQVVLYSDVDGTWAAHDTTVNLQWDIYAGSSPVNGTNVTSTAGTLYSWIIGLENQYLFGEDNQFPQWGNFTFSSSQGRTRGIRFSSGHDVDLRYNFTQGIPLNNLDDDDYRPAGTTTPVFAYSHNLGQVGVTGSPEVIYTVGNVEQPAIRFLTSKGLQSLQPWWASSRCGYGDMFDMIRFHFNDLVRARQLGAQFETNLKSAINKYYQNESAPLYDDAPAHPPPEYWNGTDEMMSINGTDQFGQQYVFDSNTGYGFLDPNPTCYATGIAIPDVSEKQSYYSIVALAARQIMGAYVLTVNPENANEPLFWQKEISSDGNVNTVDVMFPTMPFFLFANPELLRYTLEPLYMNQEGIFYPNQYSMHDLGTHFPNATGHVEGDDEYMPVEESGNMIIMTLAYYYYSNNLNFLRQHYAILRHWANYLIEYSLVPAVQLSTDDFAGQLANQTNLAIKGIVGLQAMSQISSLVGDGTSAQNYTATAQDYYTQWEYFAIDPEMQHTVLAYQWRSSWGTLYNIYPDKLLNLSIVPQRIYDMQCAWYPKVSQVFGVPLDSRHDYTKSDWEMWAAATCPPSTRRLFVDSIAYWLNNTEANVPFADLFNTIGNGSYPTDPDTVLFEARPVQGGTYSLIALITEKLGLAP